LKFDIDLNNLPRHIGIIMDGNGRYATAKGLERTEGHKAGAETLRKISEYAGELGIKYLTVYAFSTENWKRPEAEVKGIMKLLSTYLSSWEKHLGGKSVRIKVIGDISAFDSALKKMIAFVEKQTENRDGITINIALGYGGRAEIVNAAKKAMQMYKNGELDINNFGEEDFTKLLYTGGIPDPAVHRSLRNPVLPDSKRNPRSHRGCPERR
jgi:undecaprenyl diphosphate synthase